MILVLRAFAMLLALVAASPAAAAPQSAMDKAMAKATPVADQKDAAAGAAKSEEHTTAEATTAMPAIPNDAVLGDAATRAKYLNAMQKYYDYRSDGYAYRSRVFEWQLMSSRVIFAVVLVLVGAGIYFAWVQFRLAMVAIRHQAAREDAAARKAIAAGAAIPVGVASAAGTSLATELNLSEKGVSVSSPVLGVIILGLSLAFFYLYLVYVYPISNVF